MDYYKFRQVLEYTSIETTNDINVDIDTNTTLFKVIQDYTINEKSNTYIVSLSGGVDSMVLTSILQQLDKKVICIHINYNNRSETKEEEDFLRDWCKLLNIKLIVRNIDEIHRGEIRRSEYETITKNIRFDLYKQVLIEYHSSKVLLGHHKDDIIENVFNNICRGRSILDLSVLKPSSTIKNVIIERPLLSVHKNIILDYAHNNNVPYFKDTTPNWSLRGLFRQQILPLLSSAYTEKISSNLLNISDQSDDWGQLIEEKIVGPYINSIIYTHKTAEMNIEKHVTSPLCFWQTIFMRIFHQFGYSNPSRKSINNFIEIIKSKKIMNINKLGKINIKLSGKCTTSLEHNYNLVLSFEF